MRKREPALLELGAAVRHLFHQLRAVAEAVTPPDAGLTASHRGILESLTKGGPLTVPAMARARPVARQHVQVLVNDLVRFGLVETRPNPAHQRSPLVALTPRGVARFEAIRRAEAEALGSMRLSLSAARMTALAAELSSLSDDLTRWLAARDACAPERRGA